MTEISESTLREGLRRLAAQQPVGDPELVAVDVQRRRRRRHRRRTVARGAAVALVLGAGGLLVSTLTRDDGDDLVAADGLVSLPLGDVPQGVSVHDAAGGVFWLVRDGSAVTALANDAQHIEGDGLWWCPSIDSFVGPHHGEQFDVTGRRDGGPARRGLDHYRVEVTGDTVTVDLSRRVPGFTAPSPRPPIQPADFGTGPWDSGPGSGCANALRPPGDRDFVPTARHIAAEVGSAARVGATTGNEIIARPTDDQGPYDELVRALCQAALTAPTPGPFALRVIGTDGSDLYRKPNAQAGTCPGELTAEWNSRLGDDWETGVLKAFHQAGSPVEADAFLVGTWWAVADYCVSSTSQASGECHQLAAAYIENRLGRDPRFESSHFAGAGAIGSVIDEAYNDTARYLDLPAAARPLDQGRPGF